MKWAVYNILFLLVYPFLLPGFLVRMLRRGGYAARFGDRFALYPEPVMKALGRRDALSDSHDPHARASAFVWIHAVSVGEVQVAGQLMREWRRVEPGVRFCFSTTSSTGWKMAEREVGEGDVLVYNPLDFPTFVRAAHQTVRPRAVVLVESEIWPNFIRRAAKHGVPVFLVNARVSDRSAPRYRAARWLFKDVFHCFAAIFSQSALDRSRLVAAGAPAERVEVSGSFKFDVARRNPAKEAELGEWISAAVGPAGKRGRILLGGSTWPGEDEALLGIYRRLLEARRAKGAEGPAPVLVIAPRHFEKADAVEANIRSAGFRCVRRSRGDAAPAVAADGAPPVLLADTTGELMGLYALADVVFVGKSLCAHGSQNMIEPCLCGKPTVVGPYTENFRPVMSDLLAADAIVQVDSPVRLEAEVARLMEGGEDAVRLGERAAAAVKSRCGVVERCVAAIRERLG